MKIIVRPAIRQDCEKIYNLKHQNKLSIHSTSSSHNIVDGTDNKNNAAQPRLSAKELEHDGFDMDPPLYHCIVAVALADLNDDDDEDDTKTEEDVRLETKEKEQKVLLNEVDVDIDDDQIKTTIQEQEQKKTLINKPLLLHEQSSLILNTNSNKSKSDDLIVGYALYIISYPIWEGKSIFLEELNYSHNHENIGQALLKELARITINGNYADIRTECCTSTTRAKLSPNSDHSNSSNNVDLYKKCYGVDYTCKEDWNSFKFNKDALIKILTMLIFRPS